MDLTEKQWEVIKHLFPKPAKRGRKPHLPRPVLNGILWILRTGAPWKDLPSSYPPYQTCHRRFQDWNRKGVFKKVMQALAKDLEERGEIDVTESFIDGTFVPAKKGGLPWVKPNGAKARNSWPLQTALVFLSPLALKALLPTK